MISGIFACVDARSASTSSGFSCSADATSASAAGTVCTRYPASCSRFTNWLPGSSFSYITIASGCVALIIDPQSLEHSLAKCKTNSQRCQHPVPSKACAAYGLRAETDLAAIKQVRGTGVGVEKCLSGSLDIGPAGDRLPRGG